MTRLSKIFCGITLLSVPGIIYGGYFLLTVLSGQYNSALTEFQKSMFRAGHAHAGVLVILSLIAQILIDFSALSKRLKLITRIAFPLGAICISGGFFAGAIGSNITAPTDLIFILYIGIIILLFGLISVGVALIKKEQTPA